MTAAIIRAARPDEAELAARLGRETFTETFGHLYDPKDLNAFLEDKHTPETYARLIADPNACVWIAEEAGAVAVGYVSAGPCDLPVPDLPENSGELQRLYIRKGFQGSGLGGRMLTTALDWLGQRFDHIYLSVYAENFGAQRLYARHGFEKIHQYHYMVGSHPDDEWIMKRRL